MPQIIAHPDPLTGQWLLWWRGMDTLQGSEWWWSVLVLGVWWIVIPLIYSSTLISNATFTQHQFPNKPTCSSGKIMVLISFPIHLILKQINKQYIMRWHLLKASVLFLLACLAALLSCFSGLPISLTFKLNQTGLYLSFTLSCRTNFLFIFDFLYFTAALESACEWMNEWLELD